MSDTTATPSEATETAAERAEPARPALSPYLAVAGAAAAMDWYRDVFGAIETMRFVGDDGRVGHGEMIIGGSPIMLADPYPEMSIYGPDHYGGTTVSLVLAVVDVDHSYRQAVEADAQTEREPADQAHGHRNAVIIDPFGHRWMLSQTVSPHADEADSAGGSGSSDGQASSFTQTGRRPAEPGYVVMVTADRVTELGGQVLSRDEYSSGGNATCLDDQGYRFDLYRPAPGF